MAGEYRVEPTVLLPGGLVLAGDRCLREAELQPLRGYEEEWLAQHSAAPSAVVVTRLLSACVVRLDDASPTRDLIRQLLVGDRDYLMLQLRRMTLGDQFQAVFTCPACDAKMDVSFLADDVPVERRPQTVASYTLHLPVPERAERTIRFRLPTGGDQEAVLGMAPDAAVEALFNCCIMDDGGVPLSLEERQAVVEAMDRLAPQCEVELDLVCPECSHAFLAPFDITTFFFHEMRIQEDQLLREVHLLAWYYHWSEADILRLRRDRRRAYLGLLSEALRQD
jgi:hypothetical protein